MEGLLLDWKSIGSILATLVFLRTVLYEFFPPQLRQFLGRLFSRLVSAANPHVSILIDESDPCSSSTNELFDAVHAYLSDKCRLLSSSSSSSSNVPVLHLSKLKNSSYFSFYMDSNQIIDDYFPTRGAPGAVRVLWSSHSSRSSSNVPRGASHSDEYRHYELSFHRRHQARVQDEYIPYVIEESARIWFRNRERRLYTNRPLDGDVVFSRHWSSMPFAHPSTFDTLAIDPALKEEIQADLRKFIARRDYYARVGRAWKRGYLLHGAPGTGKTSLIAAIANFLEFDIYDLELTTVTSNSELRQLLVSTSSKSVIVVEDVDCTLDLSDRKKMTDHDDPLAQHVGSGDGRGVKGMEEKRTATYYRSVNLSGVLNFVDGLWSSCVGERLMIFTTNHVEKLDPALLRPGRMDKHIHLSYCGLPAFKTLAKNYLVVGEGHRLMKEAEGLLQEVEMTPAEVAEVFLGCEDDADEGMRRVVEEMKRRRAPMLQAEEHSDGPDEDDDGC